MKIIILLLLLLLSFPAVALQPLQRLNVNDQPTAINQWNFETLERDRNRLDSRVSSLDSRVSSIEGYPLVNATAGSNPVGWSDTNNAKYLYYLKAGHLVTVWYGFDGTGSGVNVAFILPFPVSAGSRTYFPVGEMEDAGSLVVSGNLYISGITATVYKSGHAAWVAGGRRYIYGSLTYATP